VVTTAPTSCCLLRRRSTSSSGATTAVIGSGDGIFAARALAVRDAGVAVQIVARAGACSNRFRGLAPTLKVPQPLDVVLAA